MLLEKTLTEGAEAERERRVFWEISMVEQPLMTLAAEVVHVVAESLAWFSWTKLTRLTMAWTQVAAGVCED